VLGRSRVINAGSGARRSCEGERLLESVRNSEFSDNLIDSEFSGLTICGIVLEYHGALLEEDYWMDVLENMC
jgi:hypothetical protein